MEGLSFSAHIGCYEEEESNGVFNWMGLEIGFVLGACVLGVFRG